MKDHATKRNEAMRLRVKVQRAERGEAPQDLSRLGKALERLAEAHPELREAIVAAIEEGGL